MEKPKDERIVVVGAGLAGALMAVSLGQAGYRVRVFERRSDPRVGPAAAGRSINLAISARGLHALERVGLKDKVLETAVPMRGRMTHAVDGSLAFMPYGTRSDQVINSVSRLGLNVLLLEAADRHPNVELVFDRKCVDVDLDSASAEFADVRSGERTKATGDALIAADGAFSAVRKRMQRLDRFDYDQSYLEHGYKELLIPPGPDGRFLIEPNALHIWPRGGYMLIALPNQDGSFTCTLFSPFAGPNGFDRIDTTDAVMRYFTERFPDAVPLMPTLGQDFAENPTSSLVTVRCRPWRVGGRVVLLGDACHAVVPFYGQGANAAFEDCAILDECIRDHAPDFETAFGEYEKLRKRHTDALAQLAIANFVEMRDLVASPGFRMRKRLEHALHRILPFWFVPLYHMVSFSRVPYADAVNASRRQWRAVTGAGAILVVLAFVAAVYFGLALS